MTVAPDIAAITKTFRTVKAAFDADAYTYECEDDCPEGDLAYTSIVSDIHLCMNNLRGRANNCIARVIVHELTHKYAWTGHGWWFGTARCYNRCDNAGCPAKLSPDDALSNADSFAAFGVRSECSPPSARREQPTGPIRPRCAGVRPGCVAARQRRSCRSWPR